jgi:hypothetical protein
MPMPSALLTVFEMSVAMAIGFVLSRFVLGRIWQITHLGHHLEDLGHRLEEQRDLIAVFQRIEAKCSEAVGAIDKILDPAIVAAPAEEPSPSGKRAPAAPLHAALRQLQNDWALK